jgi:hypothetical protein
MDTTQPTLLVLGGSKALHASARRIWGQDAVIQRCQVQTKRNVKADVTEKHWPELDQRLRTVYQGTDYEATKRPLEDTANWLSRINPNAATSLREGLEEMLTGSARACRLHGHTRSGTSFFGRFGLTLQGGSQRVTGQFATQTHSGQFTDCQNVTIRSGIGDGLQFTSNGQHLVHQNQFQLRSNSDRGIHRAA